MHTLPASFTRSVLDTSAPRVPGITRTSLFHSSDILNLKPEKRPHVSFGASVSDSSWVRNGSRLLGIFQGNRCHWGCRFCFSKGHDFHRTYFVYSRVSAVLAQENRPTSDLSVGTNATSLGPSVAKAGTDDPLREQSAANAALQNPQADGDKENIEEREKLRRLRIGMANKGRVPWNKGRQHSPETIERIRQRTYQAMHSPKVKAKLRLNPRHPQSDATRLKIRDKLREQWDMKKKIREYREACLKEWKECVAEAARVGVLGDEEYAWNSYSLIKRRLLERERTAKMRLSRVSRPRSPKSDEHRQRISAAIRAKWEDPEYKQKVRDGMSKTEKVSRPKRRKKAPNVRKGVSQKKTRSEIAMDQSFIDAVMADEKPSRMSRSDELDRHRTGLTPAPAIKQIKKVNLLRRVAQKSELEEKVYVEPTKPVEPTKLLEEPIFSKSSAFVEAKANENLQMLKLLQANRAIMEQRSKESAYHARLLMAEAEKAVRALEAAASRDEFARASLSETRRLIAEAARLIQTAESHNSCRSRVTSTKQSRVAEV